MIIDNTIRQLVKDIEAQSTHTQILDNLIGELILNLKSSCQKPEAVSRYKSYSSLDGELTKYPIDSAGYAKSFDPLEDEEGFYECWSKYGIVVGKSVISKSLGEKTISRIHELMQLLSTGECDLAKPKTCKNLPVDSNGAPILSRGFFEIYHDASLAELRQTVRLYIHHVMIWGRVDLWTSFDRFGVKLSGHEESKGLPLHVDQNPNVHPEFKTVQGVLALTDCPVERGTYVGVPGSKKYFLEYSRMAEGQGEYVELQMPDKIASLLQKNAQPIPLRASDIVSWDSRTTHANSENISDKTRIVAYIAAGPAREDNAELVKERGAAFKNGIAKNVREALMHASKPPRYNNPDKLQTIRNPEKLTLLGKLLYGKESYRTI